MLIRIVKLTFKPENIPSFERIFKASSQEIIKFQGCRKVEGYQDIKNPCVFFTYSHWDKESDLNDYRSSDFFKAVWGKTKLLFAEKPQAWSVTELAMSNEQ